MVRQGDRRSAGICDLVAIIWKMILTFGMSTARTVVQGQQAQFEKILRNEGLLFKSTPYGQVPQD